MTLRSAATPPADLVSAGAGQAGRAAGWLGFALAAGCVAIYLPVVGFDFVAFDDDHNIVFNPQLGPLTAERVAWAFTDWEYMRRYLPLGWLGLLALFSGFGLNPAGYHAAGVVLHAANALLVFAILRRLLRRTGAGPRDAAAWPAVAAFVGAAFWAWHPLRVETVAWASGLLYGQAILFMFVALWFHLGRETRRERIAELGCVIASLLTYPIALGLWPVLVCLDAHRAGWRSALRRNAGTVLATIAVLAATLWARTMAVSVFPALPAWDSFPLWQRALQAFAVWGHYLWRPWWPANLSPVDPFVAEIGTPDVRVFVCALLSATVIVVVLVKPSVRRAAALWLPAYLLALAPVLGLTEKPHFASDRYSFLVHAMMAAAVALIVQRASARTARRAILVGAAAVFLALVAASRRQLHIWENSAALWRHIDGRLHEGQLPWLKYARHGLFLYEQGDREGALAHIDGGIGRFPGSQLLRSARDEIVASDQRARELVAKHGLAQPPPRNAMLHHSVALQCLQRGDREAAAWHLLAVEKLAPEYFAAVTRPSAPVPPR